MLADSHTADYNEHPFQTSPLSRVILFKLRSLIASSCKTVDGSYVQVPSINVASFLALSLIYNPASTFPTNDMLVHQIPKSLYSSDLFLSQ